MKTYDLPEKSNFTTQESVDKAGLNSKVGKAADFGSHTAGSPPGDGADAPANKPGMAAELESRQGTFRYSDAELGGEVRTSADHTDSIWPVAKAEVFRRDGTQEIAGTTRYALSGDEAKIYPASFTARNHGVEDALIKEVGQQAQEHGATKLKVFVPDNDTGAAARWGSHGFQPTDRNPGAAGVDWEKPL